MCEIIYNKLVRDEIPRLLALQGVVCKTKALDEREFLAALGKKFQEEVIEYLFAKDVTEAKEELSDILQVLYSLAEASGFSFFELDRIRSQKLQKNGGFQQRIFLEKTIVKNCKKTHASECLFCNIKTGKIKREILAHFPSCFVIKDTHPVSPGHVLIIPNEHIEEWFSATPKIQFDLIKAVNHMKAILDLELKPDGYNVGVNCGKAAGQSILHLHVHLIPRYIGDMENPKGGIRGVIPDKQNY